MKSECDRDLLRIATVGNRHCRELEFPPTVRTAHAACFGSLDLA